MFAYNVFWLADDVYTVPEPLSALRSHSSPSNLVTDLSSENSRGEAEKQSNFGETREGKQVLTRGEILEALLRSVTLHHLFTLGSGYANVQGKKNTGYANLQSRNVEKNKSFTLDTSTGGPGSPSPTSPCPPMQEREEKEEGGISSEEENIYTPMSQDTLDSSKWFLNVNRVLFCTRVLVQLMLC